MLLQRELTLGESKWEVRVDEIGHSGRAHAVVTRYQRKAGGAVRESRKPFLRPVNRGQITERSTLQCAMSYASSLIENKLRDGYKDGN